MRGHTYLSHKQIHTYMYMYNTYIHINLYIYPVFHTRSYTYIRGRGLPDGKGSPGAARMRGRANTHPHARAHESSTCALSWRTYASVIRSSM
jgi:hypothetical protein